MGADGASEGAEYPCFSYLSPLDVRGAVGDCLRRLSAVAKSEFVILFLTCFWDTAEQGARLEKVIDSWMKVEA